MIIVVKAVDAAKTITAAVKTAPTAKTTAAAPTIVAPAETVPVTSFIHCLYLFSSSFPVSSSFHG